MHTFAKELLTKILMLRMEETLSKNEIDGIIFEFGSELTDERTLLIYDNHQPHWISLNEILYIDKPGKETLIRTMNAEYKYHDRKVDLFELFLNEKRFKFANKRLLVDVSKIKKYNSKLKIIYFHDSASNKYPLVSTFKSFVDNYLEIEMGKELDVYQEYDPLQKLVYS